MPETLFTATGSSPIKAAASGSSPILSRVAVGQSYLYPVASGASSMLIPIDPMNVIETGEAEDVLESGSRADNIVEGQ